MSETHLEASDLIRIPGGEFQMGQENGRDDERPVHRVTVAPFLLCRNIRVVRVKYKQERIDRHTEPSLRGYHETDRDLETDQTAQPGPDRAHVRGPAKVLEASVDDQPSEP